MRGEKFSAAIDAGCSFAPKCTRCPFAKCRYDYYDGMEVRGEVRAVAAEMARDGYSPEQIAQVLPRRALDAAVIRLWVAA